MTMPAVNNDYPGQGSESAVTTVGLLTADDIGTTDLVVRHEGSTASGRLTNLAIDTEVISDDMLGKKSRSLILSVHVTLTIGSITLGPLRRDHACEVVS